MSDAFTDIMKKEEKILSHRFKCLKLCFELLESLEIVDLNNPNLEIVDLNNPNEWKDIKKELEECLYNCSSGRGYWGNYGDLEFIRDLLYKTNNREEVKIITLGIASYLISPRDTKKWLEFRCGFSRKCPGCNF